MDREKWNARYRESPGTGAPSTFLTSLDELLPRRGRVLDVAGGTGRHALWLARRGLDVTLADLSDAGLAIAAGEAEREGLPLTTVQVDLERSPLPRGPWDVILCFNFLHRPLFEAFARELAHGGYLVVEHPTRSNLLRHERPSARHLLEDGELRGLMDSPAPGIVLELVRCDEGWTESGRHEARGLARART
ncbi:MAG: class I SAM-dependent methyltransferase [Myxococcaceae bacterium]